MNEKQTVLTVLLLLVLQNSCVRVQQVVQVAKVEGSSQSYLFFALFARSFLEFRLQAVRRSGKKYLIVQLNENCWKAAYFCCWRMFDGVFSHWIYMQMPSIHTLQFLTTAVYYLKMLSNESLLHSLMNYSFRGWHICSKSLYATFELTNIREPETVI